MTEPPLDDPVEALFHQAVELPPADRAAFLDAACHGNPGLRAEVESFLRMERSAPISWAVFFCGRSSSIKLIGSPPFAAGSLMAKNAGDTEGKFRPIRPKFPLS